MRSFSALRIVLFIKVLIGRTLARVPSNLEFVFGREDPAEQSVVRPSTRGTQGWASTHHTSPHRARETDTTLQCSAVYCTVGTYLTPGRKQGNASLPCVWNGPSKVEEKADKPLVCSLRRGEMMQTVWAGLMLLGFLSRVHGTDPRLNRMVIQIPLSGGERR